MLTLKRYEIHRLEEGMHKYMLSVSYHIAFSLGIVPVLKPAAPDVNTDSVGGGCEGQGEALCRCLAVPSAREVNSKWEREKVCLTSHTIMEYILVL